MTALAADFDRQMKIGGNVLEFPVEAAEIIYKGTVCIINADGFVEAASALASNLGIAGIALENSDNSAGANGDTVVRVMTGGVHLFTKASAAQTDVGLTLYAEDDDTAGAIATNLAKLGKVVAVVGTTAAWLDIGEGFIFPVIGP